MKNNSTNKSTNIVRKNSPDELEVLMEFLVHTKDGKFAVIDEGSLSYSRINEKADESNEFFQEGLYYSLT